MMNDIVNAMEEMKIVNMLDLSKTVAAKLLKEKHTHGKCCRK